MKAAAATTLALTGGYLLMEADYERESPGRRFKVSLEAEALVLEIGESLSTMAGERNVRRHRSQGSVNDLSHFAS